MLLLPPAMPIEFRERAGEHLVHVLQHRTADGNPLRALRMLHDI